MRKRAFPRPPAASTPLNALTEGEGFDGCAALIEPEGVIRKLHNLYCYINRTDACREVLRARMRVTKTGNGKLFVHVLLQDGGIQRNATLYVIERAFKCRPAIDLH
ncbi:hypothetical protein ARSEF1564_009831 [Beauveria bassiana]